jgi:hypothetical protein
MDIDILWGLEDSMNPEPQWSAWAITRTKEFDEDTPEGKNARALVRKGRSSQHPEAVEARRQRRLAIADEPASDDDLPDLESEEEDSETDSDGWTSDEDEDDDAEQMEEIKRQFEAMMREDFEEKKAQPAAAKSPERKGNPFKTLFRSLKGQSSKPFVALADIRLQVVSLRRTQS